MLGGKKQQEKLVTDLEAGHFTDHQAVKADVIAHTSKFGRKQDGIIVFASRSNS
jgi:hypothetical protein